MQKYCRKIDSSIVFCDEFNDLIEKEKKLYKKIKHEKVYGVAYREEEGEAGTVLNFCPFCGGFAY